MALEASWVGVKISDPTPATPRTRLKFFPLMGLSQTESNPVTSKKMFTQIHKILIMSGTRPNSSSPVKDENWKLLL
jgi:hypothetical protein